MSPCLDQKKCLRNCAYWPGLFEAGLHFLYTGFFVIEAATYGLILEQKFHGVLQILLINFYLVLLCLVFIRWNMDVDSVVCHLLISILSFVLTLFVGKLILMYIDYMERPRSKVLTHGTPSTESNELANSNSSIIPHGSSDHQEGMHETDMSESFPKRVSINAIMKLDPLIVILDIAVYLLISISYIVMLLKISLKLRSNSKISRGSPANLHTYGENNGIQSFYEISSSESSIVS